MFARRKFRKVLAPLTPQELIVLSDKLMHGASQTLTEHFQRELWTKEMPYSQLSWELQELANDTTDEAQRRYRRYR